MTGSTADYGTSATLRYTFNSVNQLTAIADAADSRYACAVTCDANNNITPGSGDFSRRTVRRLKPPLMAGAGTTPPFQTNHLYSIFEYDALNRQTVAATSVADQTGGWMPPPQAWAAGGTNNWVWVDRKHEYNALGALVKSGWQTYTDPGPGPGYTSSLHVYDQQTGNHLQGTNTGLGTYGTRWSWAGAQNGGYGQLFGPNADTASQNAYNINAAGGAGDPQRRTFINPTTEGDKRELWGATLRPRLFGRPMAKSFVAAWATGTVSVAQNTHMNAATSRLAFEGTVSSSDYSRITDAREKDRIGIFGTGFSYAGGSGRVTSEILGRDLNPLGRGDGMAYVGGGQNVGRSAQSLGIIYPILPMSAARPGSGNSINNGCSGCIGLPAFPPAIPGPGNPAPPVSPYPPGGIPLPPNHHIHHRPLRPSVPSLPLPPIGGGGSMYPPGTNPPSGGSLIYRTPSGSLASLDCISKWIQANANLGYHCVGWISSTSTICDWENAMQNAAYGIYSALDQAIDDYCNNKCGGRCSWPNISTPSPACTPPASCFTCNPSGNICKCPTIDAKAITKTYLSCMTNATHSVGLNFCLTNCYTAYNNNHELYAYGVCCGGCWAGDWRESVRQDCCKQAYSIAIMCNQVDAKACLGC